MNRGQRAEYAVARQDDTFEIPRFVTREEADAYRSSLYELKERRRIAVAAWEKAKVDGELHPSGTNEPWWDWHKRGWKDREWRVVVRKVTPWRDA